MGERGEGESRRASGCCHDRFLVGVHVRPCGASTHGDCTGRRRDQGARPTEIRHFSFAVRHWALVRCAGLAMGMALGGSRGSRGCQGRTRLRKWLPFYVLSLPRGHWRSSPARWCFATFRPQPLQNLRKSTVFSYPPSGSAPALSGTHARARSNVYQDISQGMPGGLTRRGGLRSQRGGLAATRLGRGEQRGAGPPRAWQGQRVRGRGV